MTERLLQYIWQFQYLHTKALKTSDGEDLQIIFPGQLNTNQGPDFLQAKIKINNTIWAGNIELHLLSSDWNKHQHSADKNFDKIILHVVWKNDQPILDKNGNVFPTLELNNLVSKILLQQYQNWMEQPTEIPCGKEINNVPSIVWQNWKERLLIERMEQKSSHVFDLLKQTNNNWEETFWRMLCSYFGVPINTESFSQIAASISVAILAKHKLALHQLEALLLGQASLLNENFTDPYPLLLQREYIFLQKKYQLQPISKQPVFLRMRPVNFPTIRLAQLAMLVHQSAHLFSKIKETNSVKDLQKLFSNSASAFWNDHYRLADATAAHKPKRMGLQMTNTLLANTVAPILFAYGKQMSDPKITQNAFKILEQLPPEKNKITNAFVALKMENKSAFDSQALLQLNKFYCSKKMCLQCAVGNAILKKSV